jgi:hypothetical protein
LLVGAYKLPGRRTLLFHLAVPEKPDLSHRSARGEPPDVISADFGDPAEQ